MKRGLILALAALLALFVAGCAQKEAEVPALLTPVGAQMDTAICAAGTMEDMEIHEGAVAPRNVALSFPSDRRIGIISVRLGQMVQAGDPLIQIDVSAINSALSALDAEQAEINETQAYEKKLYDIDMEIASLELSQLTDEVARYDKQTDISLCELEYQNAEAARTERLAAIDKERATYEAQLTDIWLLAPTDGRVAAIACTVGQMVGAYDTVCVVTDEADLVLQSDYLSESALEDAVEFYCLIAGERYEIRPEPVDEDDYARTALKGIEYITTCEIIGAADLSPGQTAAVVLVTERKEVTCKVPINALFREDDVSYVYVVENESRARRNVQVGLQTSTETEILSGLTEGEVVYVGD